MSFTLAQFLASPAGEVCVKTVREKIADADLMIDPEFSAGDESLDSRDIIQFIDDSETYITEVEEAREAFEEAYLSEAEDADQAPEFDKIELWDIIGEDEDAAYREGDGPLAVFNLWKEVASEGESYAPDWLYGAHLIHADAFKAHAQELAEDIGAIDRNADWPLRHIDWAAAAEELKQDYTEIEIDGHSYFVR